MADGEHRDILIVRRHAGHEDGHHSGAWKIAFADFMTAMMALFLVLWLISSTSEKTKHTVAQYFNPVKLVDMSTLKKGFRDPKETEMGSGSSPKEPQSESNTSNPRPSPAMMQDSASRTPAPSSAHTEAALFRDPYAILAEIAASAPSQPAQPSAAVITSPATSESEEAPADPFTTVPHEPDTLEGSLLPSPPSTEASLQKAASERSMAEPGNGVQPRPDIPFENPQIRKGLPVEQGSKASQAHTGDSAKLKSGILQAVHGTANPKAQPRIDVQETSEGVLISLTDDSTFSMFAVGSAEPKPQTVQILEKIGQLLKGETNAIVIRGHTDGRPYQSALYDNWRLSSARAHMALYMLTRGGVSEKRIERVEGYADRRLKSPSNQNGPENHRIEILVRKDTP